MKAEDFTESFYRSNICFVRFDWHNRPLSVRRCTMSFDTILDIICEGMYDHISIKEKQNDK